VLDKHSAHWWIESRNSINSIIIVDTVAEIVKSTTPDTVESNFQADVEAEAVMRPTSPLSETVADISIHKDHIEISFKEKNERFKEVIKGHGYYWDDPWNKNLSYKTESTEDRLAEIGHALLAAGFCVRIINPDVREKITTEDFTQEHTRWIGVLTDSPDLFFITWAYDDNLYNEAKKIAGSRYCKPGVTVPMEHVDELKDFAGIYKFKYSDVAERLIEKAELNKAAALVVDLKAKKKTILEKQDGVPVLDIPESVEIDSSLKED